MIIDQNTSMCVYVYNEYRSEYKYVRTINMIKIQVCAYTEYRSEYKYARTLNIDQNISICVQWI